MGWWVYIVECADGTLYTGITTNLEARIKTHNAGKGAKYTRTRLPVKCLWSQPSETRSTASREEWRIKGLSRRDKISLIENSNT